MSLISPPFLQPSSAQGIQHNSLFIFLINNRKLLLEIHKAMRHQETGHSLHNCFDLTETIVESPHYCTCSPIPLNLFSTIQPPRQVERMKQIISTLSKIVLVPVSCSIVLENCTGAYNPLCFPTFTPAQDGPGLSYWYFCNISLKMPFGEGFHRSFLSIILRPINGCLPIRSWSEKITIV